MLADIFNINNLPAASSILWLPIYLSFMVHGVAELKTIGWLEEREVVGHRNSPEGKKNCIGIAKKSIK